MALETLQYTRFAKLTHSSAVHISTVQPDPGVHVLDHSPENKLNRDERIIFLKEQLKLGESVLNPKEQDEVIDIFLRHFDACSLNDKDFGSSDLLQFHITLLTGSVLVRARCRPLNPHQEADLQGQLTEWLSAGVIEPTV